MLPLFGLHRCLDTLKRDNTHIPTTGTILALRSRKKYYPSEITRKQKIIADLLLQYFIKNNHRSKKGRDGSRVPVTQRWICRVCPGDFEALLQRFGHADPSAGVNCDVDPVSSRTQT